jgi:beta-galactosidase
MAELRTAGEPTQIALSADRTQIKSDGQDLSYITVEILDAAGIGHPKADNPVTFDIRGPGAIAAVGNANPTSLESYTRPERKAWRGRCLVIIRATTQPGTIVLKATAQGLEPAEVVISSRR